MMTRYTATILWCLLLLLPQAAKAGRQVDSYEKLELLNRATGQSSATGSVASFSNRVNTILDRTATANRNVVEKEDAKKRSAKIQAAAQSEILVTGFSTSVTETQWRQKQEEQEEEEQDQVGVIDSKLDAADRVYVEKREAMIRKSQEDALEKLQQKLDESKKMREEPLEELDEDSTGLEDNPFYFGPMKTPDQDNFDDIRHLLVSRLMVVHGWELGDATKIVASAVDGDDMVIKLMQYGDGEEFDYSEALDLVQNA